MNTLYNKEKNLNKLIDKLSSLTASYTQSSYDEEKLTTEKKKNHPWERENRKKKSRTSQGTQIFKRKNSKASKGSGQKFWNGRKV